jgi:ribosomal protein S18 acetylase RimI-like enzyme
MKDIRITPESSPQPEDLQIISKGLRDYNTSQVGYDDIQKLAVFLRDENGKVMGGIDGHTYWGVLAIDHLWLHESLRGQGHGTQLLGAAEKEAARRGCKQAIVDTTSFQAPAFYKKHGYEVYGILDHSPDEHQRIYFKKQLNTK